MLDPRITALAAWSDWEPLTSAEPPASPGVYLVRQGPSGPLVYAGMAGERRGKGLADRLRRYTSGKALASGLGEAVLDRALADPDWLRERLTEAERGTPMRATDWGRAALKRADLYICWTVTADRPTARALERAVLSLDTVPWWNRVR